MDPTTAKVDADLKSAISAINSHISSMNSAVAQADSVRSSVATNFNLPAGVAFQGQITNWEDTARQVIAKFQALEQDLQNQDQILNSANDDATGQSRQFTTSISGSTYGALTPNS